MSRAQISRRRERGARVSGMAVSVGEGEGWRMSSGCLRVTAECSRIVGIKVSLWTGRSVGLDHRGQHQRERFEHDPLGNKQVVRLESRAVEFLRMSQVMAPGLE